MTKINQSNAALTRFNSSLDDGQKHINNSDNPKVILKFKGDMDGNGYVDEGELTSDDEQQNAYLSQFIGMRWEDIRTNIGKLLNLRQATVIFENGKNEIKNNDYFVIDIDDNGLVSRQLREIREKTTNELIYITEQSNYTYDEYGTSIGFDMKQRMFEESNYTYDEYGNPIGYDIEHDKHKIRVDERNEYTDGKLTTKYIGANGLYTKIMYEYDKGEIRSQIGYFDESEQFIATGSVKTTPMKK